MLQDEDFDSDTTDEDYIPNEGKGSDDELSSDGGDAESDLGDEGHTEEKSTEKKKAKASTKKTSKSKKKSNVSKQKVNPLLAQLANQEPELPVDDEAVDSSEVETVDKKKEDDLWADFLADTEEKPKEVAKPKKKSWAELLGNKKSKSSSSVTPSESANSGTVAKVAEDAASKAKPAPMPAKASTVKVTKIFEFAGEEVRVEEEVAADSAEARLAPSSQASSSSQAGSVPVKRSSSNLSSLVSALGNKKQKLSTLEKTKLDWQSFKSQQGLEDELLLHTKSKDTYLDKQEFLQRADVRQFEIERDIRQGGRRANR